MSRSSHSYQQLIQQLDRFIRKYYANKLIRGALYSVGLLLSLYLLFAALEYYYYFGRGTRKLLFFSYLAISATALGAWVFWPALQYFRLGKVIGHDQAASIIGQHFHNVKDKLLNVLQLKRQAEGAEGDMGLLLASIEQKAEDIRLVPFQKAIDLSKNRRYLRYALPPLLLLLVLLFAAPSIITKGTARLIQNDRDFAREAPFRFLFPAERLEVVQYEDFLLKIEMSGEALPNEVYIDIDGFEYKMTRADKTHFTYKFNNVQRDTPFRLQAAGFASEGHTLEVLKKPNILGFELKLDYPDYTGRRDEVLANIGDVSVPVGTRLDWHFDAEHTDAIRLRFPGSDTLSVAKRKGTQLFSYARRAMRDEFYTILISNALLPDGDSVAYTIAVVPDLHPSISVEQLVDSTDKKLLFFVGEAADDYGLRQVTFNYRIQDAEGQQGPLQSEAISRPASPRSPFSHRFDILDLGLKPGQSVTYYFEAFDNDGVNGSKSTRSQLMQFRVPSVEEFVRMEQDNNEAIKDRVEEAMKAAKDIQEELERLRNKMLQEKELDWQTRQELEKLLERQKELEQQIQEAQEAFEQNLQNQQEFSERSEEILQKQEQLEKLFDEMMSDEMKELMQQIEELLQELNKEDALQKMEDFKMNDEELEMELDRMLELFKQLELESAMQDQIDALEKLAEEQEQLSEQTEQNALSQEELQKQQEDINEQFEDIQKAMDDIEKQNEELENPKDLGETPEQMDEIQKDLGDSQQQLQQQQNSKAAKSQKKAAQKMKDAANQMAMQMQSAEMEQMSEDIQALRQLLENLTTLSFEQEDVMKQINQSVVNTPRYVQLVQQQYKIKDDFRIVEDSLVALSKRVFQLESFVMEKVADIKYNVKGALEQLEERQKGQAAVNQQLSMKNLNDLALMLSEVMEQMQQQMANQMSGNQMCQKPGDGKGQGEGRKPQNISELQQQLNQQMQDMMNGRTGDGSMSKQFAELAKKQAALRRALEEKQKQLQQQGQGDGQLQQAIDDMNRTEKDLVNKRLNEEMLKRQEDIVTRLLESERAERERDLDEKRQSESAQERERKTPPSIEEYIRKRQAEVEEFRAVSPSLKPFYKGLVDTYFKEMQPQGN